MKRALFIDRDGTIIREPEDEQIDSLEKLEFVPGAISALAALAKEGWELVMVSNQDGLGTPSFPEEDFWGPHNKMLTTLAGEGIIFSDQLIDRTFPEDNLPTRKPGTGMLTAYMDGSYDLAGSFVIGDRLTDLELAANLGAQGIRLGSEETPGWGDVLRVILGKERRAVVERRTAETDIKVVVDLDRKGVCEINTGLKFFDHMLSQIPHHGGLSLSIDCKGDLEVDEHHTIEDVAIALGQAITKALGKKEGIERYGFALPMDESRAMVLLDLGGRFSFEWDVPFTREYVGDTPTEMFKHFFHTLAFNMSANLHVEARGENNHHMIEGVFKAFARSLNAAKRRDMFSNATPSSKGVL
ncbi:MAG: bifunctional histidinol-phosphatase/imidazoleglycerol-phosphate dehydratase HisB [Paramuribaculum sp.]|nr:bifunctional histidinol-phosphatase/imidazoleglycerol-phosphate dehydratase HisB [Paramuribaculum sp.]